MLVKKTLIVVMLTCAGVALGSTGASAATDFTHLCLATSTSDGGRVYLGSPLTTPLAATGSSLDIGTWVFAGISILIVGLACTLLPSRRPMARAGAEAGQTLPA